MYNKEEGLQREIGVWGLSANLINIIIGAGIFVLPAIVAEGLGAAGIIAYLFCGFLIAMIMLCFAELGSKVTNSGGAYSYIEAAFGKYPGFLTTNLFVWSSIAADAAVANAIADIAAGFLPLFENKVIRILFFLLLFSGLAFINVKGVKQGIGLVKINTIIKLTPLLLLVLFGWTQISITNLYWELSPTIGQLGKISLVLFFAFQGGESGLTVGGEIKNPEKTIPRGIFISILSVLILYILLQVTAQGVLGNTLSSFKEVPLAEAAKRVFGPLGFTLMILGAGVSMFGNLSGEVLNLPRVVYGTARDKVIPLQLLSKIHKKYATPYVAIIVYAGLGFAFTSTGEFKQLAVLSSASMLLVYLGVALSVIKLRKDTNSGSDAFTIPGGYTVPVISIVTILWLLSNLSRNEQIGVLIFLIVLTFIYISVNFLRSIKGWH